MRYFRDKDKDIWKFPAKVGDEVKALGYWMLCRGDQVIEPASSIELEEYVGYIDLWIVRPRIPGGMDYTFGELNKYPLGPLVELTEKEAFLEIL